MEGKSVEERLDDIFGRVDESDGNAARFRRFLAETTEKLSRSFDEVDRELAAELKDVDVKAALDRFEKTGDIE